MPGAVIAAAFAVNIAYVLKKITEAARLNSKGGGYVISVKSIAAICAIFMLFMLYFSSRIMAEKNPAIFLGDLAGFASFMAANMLAARREVEMREFMAERKRRLRGGK